MKGIKITYIIDSEEMSDQQYEDQESKEFILTFDMICEILHDHVLKKGETIGEIESIEKIN